DPALRARRRRAAQAMRGGPAEGGGLAGASLVLAGPSGLTVVLAGGPPPRPVSVRAVATGPARRRLPRPPSSAGLTVPAPPGPARRIARRRTPTLPPTRDLLDELALLWSTPTPRG